MNFTSRDYDRLEDAIDKGRRIVLWRRGTEYIVIPRALRVTEGKEALDTRHPSTGQTMRFELDDLDRWEVVA